jgi:hypothetical protein
MEEYESFEDDALVVKESQAFNIIMGAIFLLMPIVAVIVDGGFPKKRPIPFHIFGFGLLAFGMLLIRRGLLKQEILRIDCNGIYHNKKLLTDWPHFIEAQLGQKQVIRSYQDNFVLVLRYYKEGYEGCFKRTIRLTNTQDQSEEAVLETIRRFHELS